MVDAYLQALDLYGRELDLSFLNDVVARHVATFAFSSVNVRLGEELPLDFESLYDRIVTRRRGGYCFEQNGLLYEILDELGFTPELYLARVIYNQDTHPGLTHRISIVEYEGHHYVLDVGFGPLGPRIPVPMSGEETHDGDRVFRIAQRKTGEYHVQVLKDGDFYSLYRFELASYGPADCKLGHFYSHRHRDASFVNHLVVSRLLAKETRVLRDLEYKVITGKNTVMETVATPRQLTDILVDGFGIQVTSTEGQQLYEGLKARRNT